MATTVKKQSLGSKKSSSAKSTTSQWTEDWLPVRGIQNNCIVTTRKELVTGVKISPRNIFILDADSQNRVLTGLKNFYNMLDFEFWLVVADRPVDISVYMSQLQLLYNEASAPAIRKVIAQDMEKGDLFTNNNVVDTEYYILFKEKNMEIIQKRIRLMINGLANAGLASSQANNDDLRTVLDSFLNGGVRTEFGTVMS